MGWFAAALPLLIAVPVFTSAVAHAAPTPAPTAKHGILGPEALFATALAGKGRQLPRDLAVAHPTRNGIAYGVFIRGHTTAQAIASTGAIPGTVMANMATATATVPQMTALIQLAGVTRVDLAGRARPTLDVSVPDIHAAEPNHANTSGVPHLWSGTSPSTFSGDTGTGVVVGEVDSGIDIQDPDFQTATTSTRIKYLWDQAASGDVSLSSPSGFSYGEECSAANINATNGASGTGCGPFTYGANCNTPGATQTNVPEEDCDGHGTHTAGILASNGRASGLSGGVYSAGGPSAGTYIGVAPTADIVFVKTDFDLAHIVDGINYIFQKASALGEPASVNLSLGVGNGPHDGTSDFETMIDALTGPGHIVSVAAGNFATGQIGAGAGVYYHASGETTQNGTVTQYFDVQSDAAAEFDIWYPHTDSLSIRVNGPPADGSTPYVAPDQPQNNNGPDGSCESALNSQGGDGFAAGNGDVVFIISCVGSGNSSSVGHGDNEIQLFAYNQNSGLGPQGSCNQPCWSFQLHGDHVATGGFQAWTFYQGDFDFHNKPNASHGNDSFTIGEPATADDVVSVGSWYDRSSWPSEVGTQTSFENGFNSVGNLSFFSSRGPTRDGRNGIDVVAPGDSVGSSLSAHAGTSITEGCLTSFAPSPSDCISPDGAHVFLGGTSMAAPHVAAGVALLLAQNPNLTVAQVKRAIDGSTLGDVSNEPSCSTDICPTAPTQAHGQGAFLLGPGATAIQPSSGPVGSSKTVDICGVDFQTGMTVELDTSPSPTPLTATPHTADSFCPIAYISVTVPATVTQAGTYPFIFKNPDSSTGTDVGGYTYTSVPQTQFDFAEGYTGSGFQEYLTIENPSPTAPATLSFTYFTQSGKVTPSSPGCGTVQPQHRCTENVNLDVGTNQNVSAEVMSTGAATPVVVERPMYFKHDFGFGTIDGGHDAIGATSPSTTHYFAEGYTGSGFQEYITVENPNTVPLGVQFSYAVGTETVAPMATPSCQVVAPLSRCTENVNADIGPGNAVSAAVTSTNDLPFFAERPMYFSHDFGFGTVNGGHVGIGASTPVTQADLAEGYTGAGFQEYLTIQNPNSSAINMTFTYAGSSGTIRVASPACATIAADSRCTENVNSDVGANQEVSVHLSSTGGGFIAERPMYFNAFFTQTGRVNGGHDDLAVNAVTNTQQEFAEGYTGAGFQEYLTIENPNSSAMNLTVSYFGDSGALGRVDPQCATIPAHSRCTINVNADIGNGLEDSATLSSPSVFFAERPMYFAHTFAGGISVNGGHVSAGYSSAF